MTEYDYPRKYHKYQCDDPECIVCKSYEEEFGSIDEQQTTL